MIGTRRKFVAPLLDWHHENGRHSLPWRENARTPFEILLAEILLQRTTAAAVSGAYVPFIAQYPTPGCIVTAPFDELTELIAPLGLTKRARYITRCSAELLADHEGCVPRDRNDLLALHGVGEYTARSVLAHAFGAKTAAVDTNVRRLISRFFGIDPDSDSLDLVADAVVPSARSSDFLYSMLDFAADVCTAVSPACQRCPLEPHCRYAGSVDEEAFTA